MKSIIVSASARTEQKASSVQEATWAIAPVSATAQANAEIAQQASRLSGDFGGQTVDEITEFVDHCPGIWCGRAQARSSICSATLLVSPVCGEPVKR